MTILKMDVDLEEELMDLASNELSYMPSSTTTAAPHIPTRSLKISTPTGALVQQVTEQLSVQATQQVARQQNPKLSEPVASSCDKAQLTAEQLKFLQEEDERQERRNTIVKELTAMRQVAVTRRLHDLVMQFEQLLQRITDQIEASDDTGDENEGRRKLATQYTTAKLNFVLGQSALELQLVDEDVKWTRLLDELPITERDYLGRAADEKFVEQMKYLRGERGHERQNLIQRHLHGILVLTAPHRNGQTVAKTSTHHSLRQLLQAFVNIFRSCYADFLQYGGQGFGARRDVSVDRVTCTLPLVAADVTQFAAILTQVVLLKYPFLQSSEEQRNSVQRSVMAALFDALQPVLHGLYVAAFSREDSLVDDTAELSRTNPLAYFEVKPIFRLDGSWSGPQQQKQFIAGGNECRLLTLRHYNAAIHHMNNLASERSPYAKLERLAQVCREIDRAIKLYYASQPIERRPSPQQLNMYETFHTPFSAGKRTNFGFCNFLWCCYIV